MLPLSEKQGAVKTNVSCLPHHSLCPSSWALQQREEEGLHMNLTLQLVNPMTRKMTHLRLPSAVTYYTRQPEQLKPNIIYAPISINKQWFHTAWQPGWGSFFKKEERKDAECNHIKTSSRQTVQFCFLSGNKINNSRADRQLSMETLLLDLLEDLRTRICCRSVSSFHYFLSWSFGTSLPHLDPQPVLSISQ